jgi:hypothetical protein
MKKILIASLILFSISSTSLFAQQNEEVQRVIASLFEGMKSKNVDLIKAAFHPEASMQTVKAGESGSELGSNSLADFISRIGSTPANTILDERILDYQIKVDGDLAAAWTPYEFYVNENFSHCGVNSFQLIKTPEGWKITYIIDTRRKEGCK